MAKATTAKTAASAMATPARTAVRSAAKTPAKTPVKAAKTAAVKVAAKKAAPARTAAKKATPTQSTAKKAAPAKAAAKKAAPTKVAAKKAAPTKTAPAKKAAPTKPAEPAKKAVQAPGRLEMVTAVEKSPRKTTVICPLSGFEVKPEKPSLSPKTIERLQAKLLEERERHLHQADDFQAEAELLASEREGGDTQFDEESGEGDTVNIERERDLLLSASARQIVDEIDRALARIKDKTYGVCAPAGRRIALERLEALPYADTCVDCKARAERRR
jgi:RNA polymerase-binding transcription factor DksA